MNKYVTDIKRENRRVVFIFLLSHLHLSSVASGDMANNKYTALFCGSSNVNSAINLRDMTTTNEGVIRMPTPYGHQSFSHGCTVTIRVLGNAIIIFKHKRLNASSGPCLASNVINNKIQEGPCHDQRVYFNGLMHLKLEVGELFQPGFVIDFKAIDARTHKEGYITDYSFLPIPDGARNEAMVKFITIRGLPMSATVLFNLEVINMTASNGSVFLIESQQRLGNKPFSHDVFRTSTFVNNQMQRVSGNHSITIKYEMEESSKGGEYVRLKYKVESCVDAKIPYLGTLEQTHFNSSQYAASCISGHALENKAETFTCKDQQWTPALKCSRAKSTSLPLSPTTSEEPNEEGPQQTSRKTHRGDDTNRSETSFKTYYYIVIGGSIALILGVMAGSLYCLRLRYTRFKIQHVRNSRPLPTRPVIHDIDLEAQTNMDNDLASDYEVISSTDPYQDYSTINECDMITNFQQNICTSSLNSMRQPTTENERSIKRPACLSPNLLESCYREMNRRGIHFNDREIGSQNPKHQIPEQSTQNPQLNSSPPEPCPGSHNSQEHTETPCQSGNQTSNKLAATSHTDHKIYLRPKTGISIHQEQPATNDGPNETHDDGHQVASTSNLSLETSDSLCNNDTSAPLEYEDAESVYDVYFL